MKTIFQCLSEIEKSNICAAFCIVTSSHGSSPRKGGSKMIVYSNGSVFGTVGGGAIEKRVVEEALKVLDSGIPSFFSYKLKEDLGMECGGQMDIYIEPVTGKQKLYIFGAGHIGSSLAKLSSELGFEVTVIDDRPGIFSDYDHALCKCINMDFVKAIDSLEFDKNTYISIVTYKHANDFTILKHTCKKPHAYLGMLGSKRKVAEVKKQILAENLLTEAEIENINMPMGIMFAAETPQEIAVSILAKLIDVRNTVLSNNE